MKYSLIILMMFCLLSFNGLAQKSNQVKVYQLSGMVMERATTAPLPYTKIVVNNFKRFGYCNHEGFYSIPVVRGDTVQFSHIGYKTSKLIVSDYLDAYKGDTSSNYVYEIHYLLEDTISVPTITIYPYKSATDIKYAILNLPQSMELSLKDAQSNVNPELIAFFMNDLPENEADRLAMIQKRYADYYSNQNLRGTMNFVDPIAIYKFMKHITKKTKN